MVSGFADGSGTEAGVAGCSAATAGAVSMATSIFGSSVIALGAVAVTASGLASDEMAGVGSAGGVGAATLVGCGGTSDDAGNAVI